MCRPYGAAVLALRRTTYLHAYPMAFSVADVLALRWTRNAPLWRRARSNAEAHALATGLLCVARCELRPLSGRPRPCGVRAREGRLASIVRHHHEAELSRQDTARTGGRDGRERRMRAPRLPSKLGHGDIEALHYLSISFASWTFTSTLSMKGRWIKPGCRRPCASSRCRQYLHHGA
jgi:hypothetical protein